LTSFQRELLRIKPSVKPQYLLSLWNPGCQWQCGAFDPHYAVQVWDASHRRGFLELASRDATPN
jgi:hypothetical protein